MPTTLTTTLANIHLASPVLLAAGTCGTLYEMSDVLDLSRVGALVTKSITPEARDGNNTWRIIPAPTGLGMLNAIGLANPGVDAFVREYLPRAKSMPCAVLASVAGFSIDDYVRVAGTLSSHVGERGSTAASDHALAGLELNLSCPNVKHGVEFGASAEAAGELVRAVRQAAPRGPVFVKLSPVAPELVKIARAVIESGATGLTLGNTVPALAIDPETREPLLANITGGLSGPAIHHITLRAVWDVYSKLGKNFHGENDHLPIIGLGGVTRWEHAACMILAGASSVAIGTALFADPRAPLQIARGLERWCARQGVQNIRELVGAMRVPK